LDLIATPSKLMLTTNPASSGGGYVGTFNVYLKVS
jgi:hypothetical protein